MAMLRTNVEDGRRPPESYAQLVPGPSQSPIFREPSRVIPRAAPGLNAVPSPAQSARDRMQEFRERMLHGRARLGH
jgi:hypothetical protein